MCLRTREALDQMKPEIDSRTHATCRNNVSFIDDANAGDLSTSRTKKVDGRQVRCRSPSMQEAGDSEP